MDFSVPARKDQEQAPAKHVGPAATMRQDLLFPGDCDPAEMRSLFPWGWVGLEDVLLFWTLASAPGTSVKVEVQGMAPYGTRWAWNGLIGRSEVSRKNISWSRAELVAWAEPALFSEYGLSPQIISCCDYHDNLDFISSLTSFQTLPCLP